MKVNIEGGEYALLYDLINSGYIKNIENIQIQFHNNVPGHDLMIQDIRKKLEKTHTLTYKYDYVWENWSKI